MIRITFSLFYQVQTTNNYCDVYQQLVNMLITLNSILRPQFLFDCVLINLRIIISLERLQITFFESILLFIWILIYLFVSCESSLDGVKAGRVQHFSFDWRIVRAPAENEKFALVLWINSSLRLEDVFKIIGCISTISLSPISGFFQICQKLIIGAVFSPNFLYINLTIQNGVDNIPNHPTTYKEISLFEWLPVQFPLENLVIFVLGLISELNSGHCHLGGFLLIY